MNTKTPKTLALFVLLISLAFIAGCPKPLQYHGMLTFPDLKRHTEPAPFAFAAMGDSRGTTTQINKRVLPGLAYDCSVRDANVAFLVFAGDMINGSVIPSVQSIALQEWQEIMTSNFEKPIVPAIGNHEVRSLEGQEIYRQFFSNVPSNGPADELGLTYWFDYNNCRFIVIDTYFYGDTSRVRHIDWLENTLKDASAKSIDHIFVASHAPCWPVDSHLADCLPDAGHVLKTGDRKPLDEAKKFWSLLKQHNVAAYICGHEHVYARQNVDGVWQITAGASGAPFGKFNQPFPGPDASSAQKAAYEQSVPYYKLLGYPHGPGDKAQAGKEFFGLYAYQYCVFTVLKDHIRVQTFGTDSDDMDSIRLLDQFFVKE